MAFISAFLTPTLCKAAFDVNLGYGAKNNEDVKEVQEFLKDQKLYFGPVTGNYFSLTRSAVIRFQQKNKIKPANGQFTTTTREIAQKMVDPNQDVTTTIDAPTSYLEYPVGTIPMVGGQSPVVVPTMGGQPLAQVQAEALQTPVVQPVAPADQTVVNVPVATINNTTTTPTVDAPNKDTTAPKMVFFQWTRNNSGTVTWYPELVQGVSPNTWGDRSNACKNCLVVITDEPTKIKVEYTQFLKDTGGNYYLDSNGNKMTDGSVSVWDDTGKLSYDHIFITKPLFQSNTSSQYIFKVTLTDQAGNTNRQRFGNAFNEKEWSDDQTITYSRKEDSNLPEYFTVLSNVLTTY